MKEQTLNELVDDVIGKKSNPIPIPKQTFDEMMSDASKVFNDLFNPQPVPPEPRGETLVVNLFAGPGSGKSTTCSGIFFDLKTQGVECEIASEYAKDLVFEHRSDTFKDQIYMFAKQYHRIFRLLGQVDVVITDSPILQSPVYDSQKRPTLEKLVVEEHRKMWTYNVFLKRVKPYNPNGRLQTKEEAIEIDREILDVLNRNNEAYETFYGTPEGKDAIVRKINLLLRNKRLLNRERFIKGSPKNTDSQESIQVNKYVRSFQAF